ncbi:MAG: hypothetical protein IJU71_02235, partial [Selenomonadaceae bacterium]|nr:hypothetical protein [Selenomonadaceae bacterium]
MMRRCLASVFLLLTVLILASGCNKQTTETQTWDMDGEYEKVRLVMTANGTDKGIETLTARRFAKLVRDASKGNV